MYLTNIMDACHGVATTVLCDYWPLGRFSSIVVERDRYISSSCLLQKSGAATSRSRISTRYIVDRQASRQSDVYDQSVSFGIANGQVRESWERGYSGQAGLRRANAWQRSEPRKMQQLFIRFLLKSTVAGAYVRQDRTFKGRLTL